MRITSGIFGGRTIKVPPGIRPTQDKVRQALFSSLGERIGGARVLDLFAGSGALGIEAWSRGAESVCFVESDGRVFPILKENIRALCGDDPSISLVRFDAIRFLESGRAGPFDLVLADPPYDRSGTARWLEKTLIGLEGHSMFPASVLLVFELSRGEDVVERPGWALIKDKRYGETRLLTYEKVSDLSRNV
ncbi:MAG: 16S rRNA (guanine(966)-N(2))-methyltransferase RsmD [bacterium]